MSGGWEQTSSFTSSSWRIIVVALSLCRGRAALVCHALCNNQHLWHQAVYGCGLGYSQVGQLALGVKVEGLVAQASYGSVGSRAHLVVGIAVKAARKAAPKVDVAELGGQVHICAAGMAAQRPAIPQGLVPAPHKTSK